MVPRGNLQILNGLTWASLRFHRALHTHRLRYECLTIYAAGLELQGRLGPRGHSERNTKGDHCHIRCQIMFAMLNFSLKFLVFC